MEGYLEMQKPLFNKKYYFVLHDGVLFYCDKKGSRKIGQMKISICEFQKEGENQLTINTGSEIIKLKASNEQERNKWLDELTISPTLNPLEDELARIKSMQSQFEDILRSIMPKLQRNSATAEIADRLHEYGIQCKNQMNEWMDLVQTIRGQEIEKKSSSEEEQHDDFEENLLQQLKQKHPKKWVFQASLNSKLIPLQQTNELLRKGLPVKQNSKIQYNLWADLKVQANESLYKMNIPYYLMYPLSTLQKICDNMKFTNLLNEADTITDSGLRMAYIMGFIVTQIDPQFNGCQFPVFSCIGETYEFDNRKNRILSDYPDYKFLGEQRQMNAQAHFIANQPILNMKGKFVLVANSVISHWISNQNQKEVQSLKNHLTRQM